ncbi:MAG: Cytochrome c oxidase polypeptide III (EC [uncultured Thiotrichaceae bacterium]|uniref:cytochrome-c oxidase n=1 Tax=uncultured Thiotrichaceae bacterium TaxID=298394 RepID=A0A6S6TDX3_9GAMM|nr:MAG: Cytochrome c oxidase polypeptide III (EC [uncultured Thiotrichaceae bacterium]
MTTSTDTQHYFVPDTTIWPFLASIGLTSLVWGFIQILNGNSGKFMMIAGAMVLFFTFFRWFGEVVHESESNAYSGWEDKSFRLGMSWFIFSEVMFFAAFFGVLFYARVLSVPWLGGAGEEYDTHKWLWDTYQATWPTNGPGNVGGEFGLVAWSGLPLVNTLLLLSSGVTVTWAHHALKHNNRQHLIWGLAATVALGTIFLICQGVEYAHAYDINLTLGSGIYGSTFFMLTGFHGMHVLLGTIMLFVVLLRSMRGHFTAKNHFAFEAAAWYWHFVDVVWLGLFIFVYIV